IIDAFNATKHPDVISGREAPDSVFRDFVDGFFAGFSPEQRAGANEAAKVTKEDFSRYYDMVSATVPDDGYFELLLKSCWHMAGSGGTTSTKGRGTFASPGNLITCDEVARSVNFSEQQELGGRRFCGPSRRHFHCSRDTVRGGPKTCNDHFSSPAVFRSPNEGREQSFNTLRESRAAGSGCSGRSSVGPSDENRMLRSALLSRTFDSQICFGGREGENEAPGRFQRAGATEDDHERAPPPPAGGGRVGRVAEGAAWTPGGRRLIPGSTAFTSHLGSGMMAKTLESGVEDGANGESLGPRFSVTNSRALEASAVREPPVWIPKLDPKRRRPAAAAAVANDGSGGSHEWDSSRQATRGKLARDRKCGVTFRPASCHPSGVVSLAKLMGSREELDPGQGMDQSHVDNGVPASS
ncbi:unnamed protein product, partial [Hapterophycus canaliculatus]